MDKWGKKIAVLYSIAGVAMWVLGIIFTCLLIRIVKPTGNDPNPAGPPQPLDLTWLGFSLGLIIGAITAFLFYKGGFYLLEGARFFRGDREYDLLLRYHDGIATMMQKEREKPANTAESPKPLGSISSDEKVVE